MYICIIDQHLSHPSWFLRSVHALKCSVYWRAHVRDTSTPGLNSKNGCSVDLFVVFREDYQWRQVGECANAWYKWIQFTKRVEVFLPCGNLPTCLYCVNRNILPPGQMGWLYSCFVTFISTKAWHWTYYSAYTIYLQTNSAETGYVAILQYNPLRLAPTS